jgi:hypothetical protein
VAVTVTEAVTVTVAVTVAVAVTVTVTVTVTVAVTVAATVTEAVTVTVVRDPDGATMVGGPCPAPPSRRHAPSCAGRARGGGGARPARTARRR